MTLFEYLAVSVSIVLSFGVIRLLDGIPAALSRDRRYWLHVVWIVNVLWLHAQSWWTFWSYSNSVEWNYPRFMLALAAPAILYSVDITLVSGQPGEISSWRDHFYRVRLRFCVLFALWFLAVTLSTWLVLGQPFFNTVRAWQGGFVVMFLVGAVWRDPRVHGGMAAVFMALLLYSVVLGFFRPAPLSP